MATQNVSTNAEYSNHSITLPFETLRMMMDQTAFDSNKTDVVIGHLRLAFSPADVGLTTDDKLTEYSHEAAESGRNAGSEPSPDSFCNDLCAGLDSCLNSNQGSYCKIANSPSTCFALYWKTDENGMKTICFASEPGCAETDPVICNPKPSI